MTTTDRAYADCFTSGFSAVTTRKRRGRVPANITTTAGPMVQSSCSSTMPSRAPSPSFIPALALYHCSDKYWDPPSPLASPTSTSFAHNQLQLPLSPSKSTERNRQPSVASKRSSLASLPSRILAKVRSPSSGRREKSESRKRDSGKGGFWTPSRSNSMTRPANQNAASEVWTPSQRLGAAPHAGIANADDDSLYNSYRDELEQPLDPFASAPDSKSIFITESYPSTASSLPYSSSLCLPTPPSSKLDYLSYPWSLPPTPSPATSPGGQRLRHQDSLLSLPSLPFLSLTPKKKRVFSQVVTSKSTPSTPVQQRKSLPITRTQSFKQSSSSTTLQPATQVPQPLNIDNVLPPVLVPNRRPPLPPSEDQSQQLAHEGSQSYILFNSKRQRQSSSASPHSHIQTRNQLTPGRTPNPRGNLSLAQSRSYSHLPTMTRAPTTTKMSSWFIEEEDGLDRSSSPNPNPSPTSSPSPSPSPLPATPSPALSPTLTSFPKKTAKSPLSTALSSPMSLSSPKLPLSPGMQNRRKYLMEQGQKEQEEEDEKEGKDKNREVRAIPRGPRQPLRKRYGIVQFENDAGNYGDESACGSGSGSSAPCTPMDKSSAAEERHEDLFRMWGSLYRKILND